MNKDWIVDQLFKQIEELKLMTAGFKEMDHYPHPIIQLAKIKNQDIAAYLEYLQNFGKDQISNISLSEANSAISTKSIVNASTEKVISEIDILEEVYPAEEPGNEDLVTIDPDSFEPQALEDNILLTAEDDDITGAMDVMDVESAEMTEVELEVEEDANSAEVNDVDLHQNIEAILEAENEEDEAVTEDEDEVEIVSIEELSDEEDIVFELTQELNISTEVQPSKADEISEIEIVEILPETAETAEAEETTETAEKVETAEAEETAETAEKEETVETEEANQNVVPENRTMNEVLGKDNNSLNTVIGNKKITDIRQAISIGDRFRYQRELFRSNGEDMNKTLSYINQLATYTEVLSFLKSKYNWTEDNETAEDFLQLVKRKF